MNAESDRIGRTVAGKFVIEGLLGGGAMGEVFRARHVELGTHVALKVMRPDVASEPTFRERFAREARTASRLDHPNIVRVLDYGEDDGIVYLAMELIEGRTLLELLRQEHPLPDVRIADILAQALAAAGAAHELGLVHRDMKPENIMVRVTRDDDGHSREHVKVCDFGIAKVNDPRLLQSISGEVLRSPSERPPALEEGVLQLGLTSGGSIVGTPEYMSPEQVRGEELDARSDLYAIGVVLYQMLSGKVPFQGDSALTVVVKHVTDLPVPPSLVAGRVHAELERICLRAMSKRREDRFASAREMRAQVRTVLTQLGGDAATGAFRAPDPSEPSFPTLAAKGAVLVPAERTRSERDVGLAETARPDATLRPARTLWVVGAAALALGASVVFAFASQKGARGGPAPEASSAPPLVELSPLGGPESRPVAPLPVTPAPGAASGQALAHGESADAASLAAPDDAAPEIGKDAAPPVLPSAVRPPDAALGPAVSSDAPPATFDPSNARVNVRSVDARGVKEVAVRAKLAVLRDAIGQCYRSALRVAGGAVAGQPTVSLSVDERGKVMSAVVLGAEALPGLQRCVPATLVGQSLGFDVVDGPGATAEVHLELVPE